MSVISIITKNIVIEPKHLNYNIKEYVYNELKKKYERTCCDEHGLIIEINECLEMDNIINKDSIGITFTIKFKAITLKPVKGLELSFIPFLIQQKGIFGKLYNKYNNVQFFIPENSLNISGYSFNPDENYFKNENNDIIDSTSEVNIMIDQIQYDTTKYNCITKLIKTYLKNMD
jgi:DNA-directed RNA polymerase subunit E'/Rpb7